LSPEIEDCYGINIATLYRLLSLLRNPVTEGIDSESNYWQLQSDGGFSTQISGIGSLPRGFIRVRHGDGLSPEGDGIQVDLALAGEI
jgi:hypothetical protein